jgi:hypothetical protein
MNIIREKDFDIERLKNVRDIFIFNCYTGLAYVDVEKLTPDHIGIGAENNGSSMSGAANSSTILKSQVSPQSW